MLQVPSMRPPPPLRLVVGLSCLGVLAAAATCRFVEHVDYTGGLDNSNCAPVQHTGTQQGCCDACAACPECFRGIFFSGVCYLKGEHAVPYTNQDRIACITNKSVSCPAGQYSATSDSNACDLPV